MNDVDIFHSPHSTRSILDSKDQRYLGSLHGATRFRGQGARSNNLEAGNNCRQSEAFVLPFLLNRRARSARATPKTWRAAAAGVVVASEPSSTYVWSATSTPTWKLMKMSSRFTPTPSSSTPEQKVCLYGISISRPAVFSVYPVYDPAWLIIHTYTCRHRAGLEYTQGT